VLWALVVTGRNTDTSKLSPSLDKIKTACLPRLDAEPSEFVSTGGGGAGAAGVREPRCGRLGGGGGLFTGEMEGESANRTGSSGEASLLSMRIVAVSDVTGAPGSGASLNSSSGLPKSHMYLWASIMGSPPECSVVGG